MRWMAIGVLALAAAGPAAAAVTDKSASGFTVVLEGDLAMTPAEAYRRFLAIGTWWSNDHTFSGQASNMTIADRPGGCWCETLPEGGFVKHLDVTMAMPGTRLVLRGGLGPLTFMGADGAMTVAFEPKEAKTHVTLTYAVGGYDPAGWGDMSAAVDRVLAEQLSSYLDIKP